MIFRVRKFNFLGRVNFFLCGSDINPRKAFMDKKIEKFDFLQFRKSTKKNPDTSAKF